jgi:flagellar hook-length control protein FliK
MMTQSNLDYLLQVTAPLIERPPIGPGSNGPDRSGFGDHLAQASGSTNGRANHTELRERPAPSGPLEGAPTATDSSPIDHDSSDADLPPDEYGACAEYTQPAACGGEESESEANETGSLDETPVEAASDTTSADDAAAQNENEFGSDGDETESDTDDDLIGPVIAGKSDAATNSVQIALNDVASDAVQAETIKGAEHSSGQSASQRGNGEPLSPGSNNPDVATDFPSNLRKLGVEANAAQPAQTSVLAVNAETQIADATSGEISAAQPVAEDTNRASRKSSAARRDGEHAGDAAAPDRGAATGAAHVKSKDHDAAQNTRRMADKIKSTDDSRRRPNEKRELRGAQRTDSAASANQAAANTLVNDIRVDAASPSAKSAGDEPAPKPGNSANAKSEVLLHPLARSARGHAAAGRAGRAENPNSLPRIDPARFVGRVAKAIQTANERGGALQLRLSPPELGSLRLQLIVHDGVMTASLEAESPAARQLLLDHLPSLRDRLAEQNIRIERFDVDVRQDGSGGQPDPRRSHHEQRQQPFQHSAQRREATHSSNSDALGPDFSALQPRITNNGLNVLA